MQPEVRALYKKVHPPSVSHDDSEELCLHVAQGWSLNGRYFAAYRILFYVARETALPNWRPRLKSAFTKKKDLSNVEDIKKAVAQGLTPYGSAGDFVYKELEALWFLRK
ncbi:hypothetical protein BDK51DRAFT_43300 [Blyttiomyces helicus]|uniref:Uncharacterized protein n=1 Tax=Blyttiomyces helicus TaxID=388810 RepID=A0A4P9WII6_9FUNG|nr:hypothetical protein BDK51DRAFT_43300 [Blyttiomyces helicus]|eukprot:RKO90940.1 hypothetical protein BDK51DRAFT_43300 [Blyttiomyces helicus]